MSTICAQNEINLRKFKDKKNKSKKNKDKKNKGNINEDVLV